MATTTKSKTTRTTATTKPKTTTTAAKAKEVESVQVTEPVNEEPKKVARQFNPTDLILCRSVTAGWLGLSGKSGQYYVFENFGDEAEIEYQDLFALKSRHSNYIYAPHFVIEDEELLENPRWADVAKFYDDEVYTLEDVNEVLNLPLSNFKTALEQLPNGLAKSLKVKVAEKIEDGTFDSLQKIKIIDEVLGTDFRSIIAE